MSYYSPLYEGIPLADMLITERNPGIGPGCREVHAEWIGNPKHPIWVSNDLLPRLIGCPIGLVRVPSRAAEDFYSNRSLWVRADSGKLNGFRWAALLWLRCVRGQAKGRFLYFLHKRGLADWDPACWPDWYLVKSRWTRFLSRRRNS